MERIPVVLLGEKDHGKSTLLGRILYETKSFPEDRLEAIKKISETSKKRFEWAHLLDSFRYERENEMTLDTARAIAKIGAKLYEFIDVPGHRELVKNMLTGATNAEFGILLIAADEGIKKQTLEHLAIAKFLKLKKIIIAINKIDKSRNPTKIINTAKKFGYPVIPISAYSGENVDKLLKEMGKLFKKSQLKSENGFIAAVQDVYGENIITNVLEGKIKKKDVKFNPSIKRGDILSDKKIKYKDGYKAKCIFIQTPKAKDLSIESNFREVQIKKIKVAKANSFVRKAYIRLQEKTFIYNKFTIKQNGKIIGLCQI